jgi:hypothetical protein
LGEYYYILARTIRWKGDFSSYIKTDHVNKVTTLGDGTGFAQLGRRSQISRRALGMTNNVIKEIITV